MAKKSFKEQWWPEINTKKQALATARAGAIGGFIFVGMYALGLVALLITGRNIALGENAGQQSFIIQLISITLSLLLILFATFRVKSGKGRFASIFLLAAFIFEIVMKFLAGTVSVGFAIIYLMIIFLLISGIRGTWKYHSLLKLPDPEVFD